MKLLLVLIFLPLAYFGGTAPAPDSTAEGYTFEVTVESPTQKSARFNISVTGVTLTAHGDQQPYKLEKKNVKTPYKLNLDDGKYTVIVTSKAKKGDIISKVQGMKEGIRMGSATGDSGFTTLHFGFGGFFSAKD